MTIKSGTRCVYAVIKSRIDSGQFIIKFGTQIAQHFKMVFIFWGREEYSIRMRTVRLVSLKRPTGRMSPVPACPVRRTYTPNGVCRNESHTKTDRAITFVSCPNHHPRVVHVHTTRSYYAYTAVYYHIVVCYPLNSARRWCATPVG